MHTLTASASYSVCYDSPLSEADDIVRQCDYMFIAVLLRIGLHNGH